MLTRNSVLTWILAFGLLTSALLAADNAKQAKRGPASLPSPPVPALLEIGPDSPDATVITAVGAVTTLDFGDEKPLSLLSGLREQLGVEQSAPNFPGNLIHLRPSLELAGKMTNVIVETDHGRSSFFVKTIFDPSGAQRGTFHGEVRIQTAGHVSHMKGLTDRVALLERELAETRTADARKAAAIQKQHDTEMALQYERGMKEVLGRLAALPVAGQRKRQPARKAGDIVMTPVASTADGLSRVTLADLENTSGSTRPFNAATFEKDGHTVVQPDVRELLPKQKVRVAMVVRGAPGSAGTATAENRSVPGK